MKRMDIIPLDLQDCFSTRPRQLDFVLPGLLSGSLGALISPGGTGKSMLVLQAGIAVAGGPDTLSMGPIPTGRVVYVSAEDPQIVLHHRLHALGQGMQSMERQGITENLSIYPVTGLQINIISGEWQKWLREIATGTRLLIIDTLRRVHTKDENNSAEIAVVLGVLESIIRQTDCTILFLHHSNKSAISNGNGGDAGASRGSSVLTDNVRAQYNLVAMTEAQSADNGVPQELRREYLRLVAAKVNYCPPLPDRWYRRTYGGVLKPVNIGETAAASQTAEPQPEPKRRGRRRRPGVAEAAYEAM